MNIFKVFTKEYIDETKRIEFIKQNINKMKLSSNNYDADSLIESLKNRNYVSNFSLAERN